MGSLLNWFKTSEQYADLQEDYAELEARCRNVGYARDYWRDRCYELTQENVGLQASRGLTPDLFVQFHDFVDRLFVKRRTEDDGLLHPAVGIAGEAGELLDAVKKSWAYGKPLDRENVIEELGDLYHYMTMAMIVLGIGLKDVIDANMTKLKKRYPDGYSDQAAIERKDKVA